MSRVIDLIGQQFTIFAKYINHLLSSVGINKECNPPPPLQYRLLVKNVTHSFDDVDVYISQIGNEMHQLMLPLDTMKHGWWL